MEQLCDDLVGEVADLDAVVSAIGPTDWDLPSAAAGWSVRDQISHLWFFDLKALLALSDPATFEIDKQEMLASGRATEASVDPGRAISAEELRTRWLSDNAALVAAARATDPSVRVPWYGPGMGARSFITARLMEVWAHGQDIVDVVGGERPATDRLRHVAHIGVGARAFSYLVRGREVPTEPVHVSLTPPSGGPPWTWNDPASASRVSGDALDFCLLVTQRRHRSDVRLDVVGELAEDWMAIAQAFAGPPGAGRAPLNG